ncbi:MAG TPA: hypothetical protein VH877_33130 [Polyangia bacterium]|jgi:hypothetical protein|nr:hypothetical protein [Polyangia bacterium]
MRSHLSIAVVSLTMLSSCSRTVCGTGTVARFDSEKGVTECVAASASQGVQCDPATTLLQGGLCLADASKFPSCGPGTRLDPGTRNCVPSGTGGGVTPPPCDAQQPSGTFCINGTIRSLRNDAFTTGVNLEVRIYNPLAFIADPQRTPPEATVMTSDASFVFNGVQDTSGIGLVAVAVTAPGAGTYVLGAVGLQGAQAGGRYTVEVFAVESALVLGWDQGAGLSGTNTFEAKGAYVARFIDEQRGRDACGQRVAGVVLTESGQANLQQFFFRGDLATIDPTLQATDAATGSVVTTNSGSLTNYTGSGGRILSRWETLPGASAPGVVFVQPFHILPPP